MNAFAFSKSTGLLNSLGSAAGAIEVEIDEAAASLASLILACHFAGC
jgi:hypothetical protein